MNYKLVKLQTCQTTNSSNYKLIEQPNLTATMNYEQVRSSNWLIWRTGIWRTDYGKLWYMVKHRIPIKNGSQGGQVGNLPDFYPDSQGSTPAQDNPLCLTT